MFNANFLLAMLRIAKGIFFALNDVGDKCVYHSPTSPQAPEIKLKFGLVTS